jgi:hypothetical protein
MWFALLFVYKILFFWVCSNEKYSLKKFHTFGIVTQSYFKANSLVIFPMNWHEVKHLIVIAGSVYFKLIFLQSLYSTLICAVVTSHSVLEATIRLY